MSNSDPEDNLGDSAPVDKTKRPAGELHGESALGQNQDQNAVQLETQIQAQIQAQAQAELRQNEFNQVAPSLDDPRVTREKLSFLTEKVETGIKTNLDLDSDADEKKSREFTVSAKGVKEGGKEGGKDKLDASANAGLFFPIGLRQHFQLRKADTGKDSLLNEQELKILKSHLDELILQTYIGDDARLTAGEKAALFQVQKNLSQTRSLGEALSNALHLARLLQHLRYIEEAKKATSFALGIDPDNHLGKQLFKELERVHPTDLGTTAALATFNPISKEKLKTRIINLSGGSVTVIGDLLIDRLLEGKPERISREAPVLILEHVSTEHIPGGAANTAHNVTAIGGKCHAIGICGKDEFTEKLGECLENYGITHDLVQDESRPTTVKTRIISKSHSLMQQLLRIDRISHEPISKEVEKQLIDKVNALSPKENHALVLSDYKAGVITDGVIEAVKNLAKTHNLLVIVDAQGDFQRFQDCTLMTPNQPDAEAYARVSIADSTSLAKLGEILLAKSGVKNLLVTRGGEGMVLFQKGKPMFELPAFNRSDVFDVTGAGDTVVATMALALTTGATMEEAMALGNLAASIVVRKPGTAVTSQREMLEHLDKLNLPD